jgi:hypothetical protein
MRVEFEKPRLPFRAAAASRISQSKALGRCPVPVWKRNPPPALAIRRIARRVKMGGHSVPEADVKRRFSRSLTLFLETYALPVSPKAKPFRALATRDLDFAAA